MQALGLSVLVIGLKMALSGENMIAPIGYLLLGGLTGELEVRSVGRGLVSVTRADVHHRPRGQRAVVEVEFALNEIVPTKHSEAQGGLDGQSSSR